MSFLDTIKARIGGESYSRLEKTAEKEVALAMQMPLVDGYQQQQFYIQRFLLGELLTECESFERTGLKILPIDIVNVLFRCKLLFAAQTEHEYRQRGGGVSLFDEFASILKWPERTEKVGALIDRCITRLEAGIKERTLLTHISSFDSSFKDANPQKFFEDLFATLGAPFVCFFDGDHLIEKHKRLGPGLRSYDLAEAKQFFCAPSIGFTVSGSRAYCHWYSSMWLRTFLNILRIASYVHPGQRDFGRDVKMTAPTFPVYLGEHAQGCYRWDEDKNESWAKIPDGCLFLSFGYRGLSKMWLDRRTFPKIEKFMALDILSSATQIPDLGAKILLVYCCLEHLFVPKDANTENKKYIIGGMNALAPHLLTWFNRLYNLRCAYAHKGFVLRDEETMAIITDSMKNVMTLLVAKLSVS
jgi:hypothetical protein